jgi:hypothetical protein
MNLRLARMMYKTPYLKELDAAAVRLFTPQLKSEIASPSITWGKKQKRTEIHVINSSPW